MKKICSLVIVIILIATLCSCKKINDDIYSSSNSEPYYSSEISTVTSETEESDVSDTESDDITSNITVSTPVDSTSSEPVVDNSSKEEPKETSSKEQTTEEKPKEPINFVPNRFPVAPGAEETAVAYGNEVIYNEIRYAYAYGQSDGVDCGAIITLDDNDECLNCISIVDREEKETGIFTVYNDRIYFLKFPINDSRDYNLINTLTVCSMNLSGGDKRQEKEIKISFTHIDGISCISNSKYWIFWLHNVFDYTYDLYRYNVSTNEFVKLNKPEFDEGFYIKNEQIFVYDSNNLKFYVYDINFNNKQLFFDASYLTSGFINVDDDPNGFILSVTNIDDKYFLDLNGNISKK